LAGWSMNSTQVSYDYHAKNSFFVHMGSAPVDFTKLRLKIPEILEYLGWNCVCTEHTYTFLAIVS
jgi:hypothetical protein